MMEGFALVLVTVNRSALLKNLASTSSSVHLARNAWVNNVMTRIGRYVLLSCVSCMSSTI
jgi:hypothetical protein